MIHIIVIFNPTVDFRIKSFDKKLLDDLKGIKFIAV